MKNASRTMLLLGIVLSLGMLIACASQPHKAQVPLPDLSIGVASFFQPTNDLELMAGYIPDKQGLIDANAILRLDTDLRAALNQTSRSYKYLDPIPLLQEQKIHRSEQPGRSSALA